MVFFKYTEISKAMIQLITGELREEVYQDLEPDG